MRTPIRIYVAVALACAVDVVHATEFRSVGGQPAVLYDAPSQKANKLAVLGRFNPVEVLVKLDKWTKIRDSTGELAWIENPFLSEKRFVIVTSDSAEVRAQPNPVAVIVFEAQRQVLLEPAGPAANGWIPVRHRDGQQGFVRTAQVWGE